MDDLLAPLHGLTLRALTADDVDDVVALANTCEMHDVGYPMWEHEDLTSDFRLPDVDVSLDLRTYRPGDDEEALGMLEDAFAEVPGRPPSTLATWQAMTIERDGFVPDDLLLAEHEGEIVGGAFLIDSDQIWVDKFAVRRDHRDRGIARALLQVTLQRGFDRGYTQTSLSTDSDRSAITFYEKIGMYVRESYTHRAIDL